MIVGTREFVGDLLDQLSLGGKPPVASTGETFRLHELPRELLHFIPIVLVWTTTFIQDRCRNRWGACRLNDLLDCTQQMISFYLYPLVIISRRTYSKGLPGIHLTKIKTAVSSFGIPPIARNCSEIAALNGPYRCKETISFG